MISNSVNRSMSKKGASKNWNGNNASKNSASEK